MDNAAESKATPAIDTSRFRLLHTMLRVFDLDRSIDFYTRLLGMRVLHKREVPAGRYTNAFVGYDDEATGTVIELTYNWEPKEPYTIGSGFGHLASARYLCALRRARQRGREDPAAAGPVEVRHDPHRLYRGPRRL